ncbi:MAG: leucine-rich repeat domain-containing protein [Bacteroidaceae bacterium]|nr:leucine-rich repeat domain-containing protein [Bacteroidaceae bacterium]
MDCSGNSFTSLDISYNTKLQRLTMKNSKVTSLDQSFCPDLHYMNCEGTPLGRLRIFNNNKEMDTLIVKNCSLDVLTLSDGINKMKHLDCSNNNIGALSLSNMPELLYLDCSNNQLPSLDITSCKSLKWFYAHHNRLISIEGVEVADGPTWENYDADAFTPQEPTTRRFERVSYNGGEAWALYLGISDASRILNFKKDGVSASPVISNKYLIVSDNLSQIPQKVEYDFKPYATKNAFHVVVNYDVKDYNIFVDGQKMTSLNFFDIPGLVSGKAYFEDKPEDLGWAGEPTLVLDNATLECDEKTFAYGIYNNNNYYFTIKVIGNCSITSKNGVGIELDAVTRTTVEGGGTLNIFSKNTCIQSFVLAELTIQDNTKIIGRSTDGRGYYEGDVAKLEIKDGAVFAVNSKYEPLYLDKDKPVFGEGIDIRYPEGAYFSGTYNYLYYADGTEVKNDWVVIGPDTQATHDLIDGVDEIDNGQRTTDNGFIYNLAGQQIVNGKLPRGIYIKDGKKIIKK